MLEVVITCIVVWSTSTAGSVGKLLFFFLKSRFVVQNGNKE